MNVHDVAAWVLLLLPFVFLAALIFAGHRYKSNTVITIEESDDLSSVARERANPAASTLVGYGDNKPGLELRSASAPRTQNRRLGGLASTDQVAPVNKSRPPRSGASAGATGRQIRA